MNIMKTENSIRTLIVDDEPLACRRLARMLSGDQDIEIAGVCKSGTEALATMRDTKPDLLFLDIRMPDLDAFSVLQSMPLGSSPYVIFVTAFHQYAIRAFEVHALDYVLKPYDEERIKRATERAKSQIRGGEVRDFQDLLELIKHNEEPQYIQRFLVKQDHKFNLVHVDEIDWIEAVGRKVMIHSGETSYTLSTSIGTLEPRLDPARFLRNHRSSIINLDRIREFRRWTHGEFKVLLVDGTELRLTRSQAHRFKDLLGEK